MNEEREEERRDEPLAISKKVVEGMCVFMYGVFFESSRSYFQEEVRHVCEVDLTVPPERGLAFDGEEPGVNEDEAVVPRF